MALTATACGAHDSAYETYEHGRITVDRPTAWSTSFPVHAPWTVGYEPAPDAADQIQISDDFGEYTSAPQALSTLIGPAQVTLPAFTVVSTRDLDVPEATSAQAVRYTTTDPQGGLLYGEWVVAVRWPYPQAVAVSVLGQRYDPDLEHQVVDSLELHPVLG